MIVGVIVGVGVFEFVCVGDGVNCGKNGLCLLKRFHPLFETFSVVLTYK